MKHRLILHGEKCCACAACQIGCLDVRNEDPNGREPGCRRILRLEQAQPDGTVEYLYGSAGCMHCADAPCIAACPRGCISRDPDTGFVVYDNRDCIRCRRCLNACPYGIPQFREDGKMVKCDGCNSRVKQGLQPACVLACPFGALECVLEDQYAPRQDALPGLLARQKRGG